VVTGRVYSQVLDDGEAGLMRQEPGHLGVSRDVRHRIGAFDPIVGGVSVGGRSSIIWPEGDGGEDVGGAEKQGEPTGYRRCQIAGGRDTGHVAVQA